MKNLAIPFTNTDEGEVLIMVGNKTNISGLASPTGEENGLVKNKILMIVFGDDVGDGGGGGLKVHVLIIKTSCLF